MSRLPSRAARPLSILAAALPLWLAIAPAARAAEPRRCLTRDLDVPGVPAKISWMGLVVSGPRRELVFWSREGHIQVRHGAGDWSPVQRVAAGNVSLAYPDDDGILLVRDALGATSVEILLVALDGRVADHWSVPPGAGTAFGARHQRWWVTKEALTPLEPGTKLGRPEALSAVFAPSDRWGTTPTVLDHSPGRVVLCSFSPPLMEGSPDFCQRTGASSWSEPNPYREEPILCGGWVVHVDLNTVAARALSTGRIEKEKRFPSSPRVACVGPGVIAVGQGRTLSLLELPTFKPASPRSETVPGRIDELLALGSDELLVGMRGVPSYWTASRSCLMSPPQPKQTGTHGRHRN